MRRFAACAVVVVILGCARQRDDAAPPSTSGSSTPLATDDPSASASDIVARTVCDHYWKFTSTSARPYDSLEACVTSETKPRECSALQAQACSTFAKALAPGKPGNGLLGSADCAACLAWSPAAGDPYAEQRAALERATLTVHSATVHKGAWPADVASQKDAKTILLKVDVALTGYGYRIDPDDFELILADGGATATAISGGPYTERLTAQGKPVAWDDPAVVDDPDLRIVAFFPVPTSERGKPLAIRYDGKVSAPFELR